MERIIELIKLYPFISGAILFLIYLSVYIYIIKNKGDKKYSFIV